jgi:GAF domain-containing protein
VLVVSRFDLRDISDRLSRSSDAEAVVFEFLGALQSAKLGWRATLAFYEVSRDALVKVYERDADKLVTREISVAIDQLPARMIRSFFHPNAYFDPPKGPARNSMLSPAVHSSPAYHADLGDAVLLRPLLPVTTWESCVVLPLNDREEVLAVLVVVSERRNAFAAKALEEVALLRSLAALALSQRLRRATQDAVRPDENAAKRAAFEFQERIEQLSLHARELEQDNISKNEKLVRLAHQIEHLDRNSTEYQVELERVQGTLLAIEAQSAMATQNLSEASTQLDVARTRLEGMRRTCDFMKDAFEMLAEEHDPAQFPATMVWWLCEHFGLDRCSVMLVDRAGHHLRIAAHHGIEDPVAEKVHVRIGQGVAGWVAQNRKPLFVRVGSDAPDIARNTLDTYSSESFVCAPIVYDGRLMGVLNLSNKRDQQPFDESDLDRAILAAGIFAITLGSNDAVRRTLVWAA